MIYDNNNIQIKEIKKNQWAVSIDSIPCGVIDPVAEAGLYWTDSAQWTYYVGAEITDAGAMVEDWVAKQRLNYKYTIGKRNNYGQYEWTIYKVEGVLGYQGWTKETTPVLTGYASTLEDARTAAASLTALYSPHVEKQIVK